MKRISSLFLLFLFAVPSLFSHPHVYIDAEMAFRIEEDEIAGIVQRWTLLRNFSPELIEAYDLDENGAFEENEQDLIYREAFAPIAAHHYFTHIMVDGIDYYPTGIEEFQAEISGQDVIFSFYIPCGIGAMDRMREVEISTHDPSTYVSFALLYVDDPYSTTLDYRIRFLRDGSVYSHAEAMGHLRLLVLIEPNTQEAASRELSLAKASAFPPAPSHVFRNPFLLKNSPLPSAAGGNPFF